MPRRALFWSGLLVLAVFADFGAISSAHAQPYLAGSPYDLINAVNALRASYGRTPYSISPILMYTAQSQADFLAATGSMTHAGPGGIGVTDRLLAAGYPLAGDLSLGGFRSENITGGPESMSVRAAVDGWTGDAPHLTTMISADLTEIGAGVAVSEGKVYYVIDAALPTTSGAPAVLATSPESGSAVPAAEAAGISPVLRSTPNADGDVIQQVKPGQSLWGIAIAYEVKIDEIKRLNGLAGNDIYPDTKLLIKKADSAVITSAPETATDAVTSTPAVTAASTSTYALPLTSTPVVRTSSASRDNSTIMKAAIGIIALGLLAGGIVGWLGGAKHSSAKTP